MINLIHAPHEYTQQNPIAPHHRFSHFSDNYPGQERKGGGTVSVTQLHLRHLSSSLDFATLFTPMQKYIKCHRRFPRRSRLKSHGWSCAQRTRAIRSLRDDTPVSLAPVAALFVSNFPSCRSARRDATRRRVRVCSHPMLSHPHGPPRNSPASHPISTIVIAVIVIVMPTGIMDNAKVVRACRYNASPPLAGSS